MVEWLTSQAPRDYAHFRRIDGQRICELAEQGDTLAIQSVERETQSGIGIGHLVTLFSQRQLYLAAA